MCPALAARIPVHVGTIGVGRIDQQVRVAFACSKARSPPPLGKALTVFIATMTADCYNTSARVLA